MPRFVFHVEGASDTVVSDHSSLAEAKCEAVSYAGKLICDAASTFWDTPDFHMWVTDGTGLVLFDLRFIGTTAPAAMQQRSTSHQSTT
jgi:hypothetical protein